MDQECVETAKDPTRRDVRRSLSLLTKVTHIDLGQIIRSSSLTSRRISADEGKPRTRRHSRRVTQDYVKNDEMVLPSEPAAPDSGPDSALLSRSPSKASNIDTGLDVVPELPQNAPLTDQPQIPPPPRQSRPLSAATTNTASTVTPSTLTPRRRVPSRIPVAVKEEPAQAPPKQPQLAPKNFHLFGISLSSPRKSSFGSSRPPTPSEAGSAKKDTTAALPKTKPKVVNPKPEAPAPSSKLSKLFVGTGMRVSSPPERTKAVQSKPSSNTTSSKTPAPKPSPAPRKPSGGVHISPSTIVVGPSTPKTATKQPSRRYMSEVGNTTHSPDPPTPTPASRNLSSSTSVISPRTSGTSAIAVRSSIGHPRTSILSSRTSGTASQASTSRPRVVSTGAGDSRSAIGISTRASATTLSTSSSFSTRERRASTDSLSQAPRPYVPAARLSGIEEGKGKEEEVGKSPASGFGRNEKHVTAKSTSGPAAITSPPSTLPMPTATATKISLGSVSSRKHGSFDFERPGWGSLASRGAASTLGIAPRARREPLRAASSVDGHGDRVTDAGIAGVGAARFYASTSAGKTHRNVRVVPPPTPPELEPSHTGASASTSASQTNVGTSSWGRSTGKRLSAGFSKLTSGLGIGAKSTKSSVTVGAGKERQHGKFAFEPPVPLSPKMTRELSLDSEHEQRGVRPMSPGKGHNPSHSTSSTTSSTHTGLSVGHRSGKKPRSMDLGLGLSWAPTKVREDAVLPESSFGRSLNASRREKRGREVAEEFRNALDEDGFKSFKKYVHRFDAHEIPFDGPTGIITRVERLLRKARHLSEEERERLFDSFVKLTLQAV